MLLRYTQHYGLTLLCVNLCGVLAPPRNADDATAYELMLLLMQFSIKLLLYLALSGLAMLTILCQQAFAANVAAFQSVKKVTVLTLLLAMQEHERVLSLVPPVTRSLLRPHLEDVDNKIQPGAVILTWASMNIDGYLHHIHQASSLVIVTLFNLHVLPDEDNWEPKPVYMGCHHSLRQVSNIKC